jgi:glutamate-5-semialdehyde dehydrogenase
MLRDLVLREAKAANDAFRLLDETRVGDALMRAAARLRERPDDVLEANAADVGRGRERLDAGSLDRLVLDAERIERIAREVEATAALPPLERDVGEWTLAGGERVTERRVPIGTIGANFEARPNVAADIASQVLKSGNTVVMRTGSAALGTVTALVDTVLRPALAEAGIPEGAVGLVRSDDRAGAEALVSCPRQIPLVILRGSGPSTAHLARRAAEHGVRTLAHAEGGGVLYAHAAADPALVRELAHASLDRLGVCNRLNLALVDAGAAHLVEEVRAACDARGVTLRGGPRAAASAGVAPQDEPVGHEWASDEDPDRVATVTVELVDGIDEALRIANEATSGLAASIVTADDEAARRFLDGYRGTAAFRNATTRLTDGFKLTGTPETGINVDWTPGPRGPVTYRDLWLRQYRVVRG